MTIHKFIISDLEYLENNPPVGKHHLLVVGTFNADINGNEAKWFYGRPGNEFWCLLPRMMDEPTLHPVDRVESLDELVEVWKIYCKNKRIIIVDLFKTISTELKDHNDKEFAKLKVMEYSLFDFKKAFLNSTFDGILFTWKGGEEKNTLTSIKKEYETFFESKGSKIMHMLTPALTYPKPRSFKLAQWKNEYEKLKS